jgi:hypothetical protein
MTAAHYSGFIFPASSLEGMGRWMGLGFPSLWFQTVSIGVFAKGLDISAGRFPGRKPLSLIQQSDSHVSFGS